MEPLPAAEAERRQLSPQERRVIAAAPFVLAALLVLLFDVLREIPLSYSCGEDKPAGHDAAVAAYRSGALPLHLLVIGCTLGALALLSAGRGRGPLGVGWPTLIAATVAVVAALLGLLGGSEASAWVLLPLILIVIGLTVVAGLLGAQATGVVAVLLLLGSAAWLSAGVAVGRRTLFARIALWALVMLTGAHLLLVEIQGHGAFLC